MNEIIRRLNSGEKLSRGDAEKFFEGMIDGALTEAEVASTLMAIRHRGETPGELSALVTALDRRKRRFELPRAGTIDTCGTGGDGKSTVNISTAVSIILASMGYAVVKHGNSAQSGKVGSADILKDLGFDLEYGGSSPEGFFQKHGFVFLMAPHYHPSLRAIGKIRREIRVPTIFNFVGPLVNPADPVFQIIGISRLDRLEMLADAIMEMGRSGITVYSSEDGFDEVSSRRRTLCITVKNGAKDRFSIEPSDFFTPFDPPVVRDRDHARDLFLAGLSGRNGDLVNLLALNTALALYTMGESGLDDGFKRAREHIMNGGPGLKLEELLKGESVINAHH